MHLLIGFGIVIGLVAFAFGASAARNTVRTVFGILLAGFVVFIAWFAYAIWDELRPIQSGKIPAAYQTTPTVTPAHAPAARRVEFDLTKDTEVTLVRGCLAQHDFDRDYQSQCIAVTKNQFYAMQR